MAAFFFFINAGLTISEKKKKKKKLFRNKELHQVQTRYLGAVNGLWYF